jgi:hypothetical protein
LEFDAAYSLAGTGILSVLDRDLRAFLVESIDRPSSTHHGNVHKLPRAISERRRDV